MARADLYRIQAQLQRSGIININDVEDIDTDFAAQYVHVSVARTISAQHTFAPSVAQAPFALGANAQGQLVTGLNADTVDGSHAAAFAAVAHTHVKANITDLETITTTPTASAVPKADGSNKIAAGWLGGTPTFDGLDLPQLNVNATGLKIGSSGAHSNDAHYHLTGTFTGSGGGATCYKYYQGGVLTGQSTNTSGIVGSRFTNPITTPGATIAITRISQVEINEPQITVGSGDTITTACTLYIFAAPTEATYNYAIFSDQGINRFDGDGSYVFELPADATDPTGGGGAATGRIPVLIGGVTRYLAYY